MNEQTIVTMYVVIDDVLKIAGHHSHVLSRVRDAEVRSLCVRMGMGYLWGRLSVLRLNRRLHALRDWLVAMVSILGEVLKTGEV